MVSSQHRSVISVFHSREAVDSALQKLQAAGFDPDKISVTSNRSEGGTPSDRTDTANPALDSTDTTASATIDGDYAVVLEGTTEEVDRAESVLNNREIHQVSAHKLTDGAHEHSDESPITANERQVSSGEDSFGSVLDLWKNYHTARSNS